MQALVIALLLTCSLVHAEDVTGWSWRLTSNDGFSRSAGLLEVLPAGQSDWGTVCIAGFGVMEAMAMCRTLGYTDTLFAFASTRSDGWGVGPVYLSDVYCPEIGTASNCSFHFDNLNATNGSTCSHALDVYLDCTNSTSSATTDQRYRSFMSVVLSSNFSTEAFAKRWAWYFNMSVDRVMFLPPFPLFGEYLYVNWTIVDDNSTISLPHGGSSASGPAGWSGSGSKAEQVVPEGQLSGLGSDAGMLPNFTLTDPSGVGGLFPFPIPGLSGQEGASIIGLLPREILMYIVAETYAATLWEEFGIFEQRDNLTMPNGPVNVDHSTWSWSLQSADPSLSSRFGRVQLQPGPDAMYGSICSSGTDASLAMALCSDRFPNTTLATLIPHFHPMKGGVIYASNVRCGEGAASCNMTMSTQFEKRNPCTHLDDVGILCGRQVVADPLERITYGGLANSTQSSFCTDGIMGLFETIANITNIPASRFELLLCSFAVSGGGGGAADQYQVNFTFTSSDDLSTLARADIDLIMQSTNEATFVELCGLQLHHVSQSIVTEAPTGFPTDIPTNFPTDFPTDFPTSFPTDFPTDFPTAPPTSEAANTTTTTTAAPPLSTTDVPPLLTTTTTTSKPITPTTTTTPPMTSTAAPTGTSGLPATTTTTSPITSTAAPTFTIPTTGTSSPTIVLSTVQQTNAPTTAVPIFPETTTTTAAPGTTSSESTVTPFVSTTTKLPLTSSDAPMPPATTTFAPLPSISASLAPLSDVPTSGANTTAPTPMSCPAASPWPYLSLSSIPFAECGPTLKSCYASFCSCVSGTFSSNDTQCTEAFVGVASTVAVGCVSSLMTCAVASALGLYVPMSLNISADVCVSWPTIVAQAYSDFYSNASMTTTTSLVTGCRSAACSVLAGAYSGAIDYGSACTFATLSSTPTYRAPTLFLCPDGSVASNVSQCLCFESATISDATAVFSQPLDKNVTGEVDPSADLSAAALAVYEVQSGSCAGSSLDRYLQFGWVLRNASAVVLTVVGSSLFIAADVLPAGVTFTLTLTVSGFSGHSVVQMWSFATVAPLPVLRFQLGSSVIVSNVADITLTAIVDDPFAPASPSFNWSCVAGSAPCPSLANSSKLKLFIAGGASPGTCDITLNYRSLASATIRLQITDYAVPVARILMTSQPIVASPIAYLSSQRVILAARYSGFASDNVTYTWLVNNQVVSDSMTLEYDCALLQATAMADMMTRKYFTNIVTLRVAPTNSTDKYGESKLEVVVLPTVALGLKVSNANATKASAASQAVALVDTLLLEVTPDTSAAVTAFGLSQSIGVEYRFGSADAVPLSLTATSNASRFTATAPLLATANNSEQVFFVAYLRWGGTTVTTSTIAMYTIVNPTDMSSAATAQISEVQNIKDPAAAVSAVTNMAALMNSGKLSDEDKGALAAVAVNVLVNTVASSAASLTSDQQSQLLGTVSSSLATQSKDDTQRKVMSEKVAGIVTTMINSRTFDLTRANDTLATLSKFDASAVGTAVSNLAMIMANDPAQPTGKQKTITSGNLSISTVKNTAANIGGTALSTGGATMSIPVGSGIAAGSEEDALVAIGSTFSRTNTQRSAAGSSLPLSGVASYDVSSNGKSVKVANLNLPIAIGLGKVGTSVAPSSKHRAAVTTSVSYVCKYFDETTGQWGTDGVATEISVDGSVTCKTTHFTAFGVFSATTSTAGVTCPGSSSASLVSIPTGCGGVQRVVCEAAACSALGGMWSNLTCVLGGNTPDEASTRSSISQRMTCLVQMALNVTREAAAGAATTTECASWASSLSLEYSDWYAGRGGMQVPTLQQSCATAACTALKAALPTTTFTEEYNSLCTFGNASAAPPLSPLFSHAMELRIAGKNWASVLASNRSALIATLTSSISSATGLTAPSIVIDSLTIGSLVAVFRVRSALSTPSSSLITSSLLSTFSTAPLLSLYQSSPSYDGTESISVLSLSDTKDVSESKSNAGAIAGGLVGGLAFLFLIAGVTILWRRRQKQSRVAKANVVEPVFCEVAAPSHPIDGSEIIISQAPPLPPTHRRYTALTHVVRSNDDVPPTNPIRVFTI